MDDAGGSKISQGVENPQSKSCCDRIPLFSYLVLSLSFTSYVVASRAITISAPQNSFTMDDRHPAVPGQMPSSFDDNKHV